jgi:hypothetical protein
MSTVRKVEADAFEHLLNLGFILIGSANVDVVLEDCLLDLLLFNCKDSQADEFLDCVLD